ncbi:ATP-binding protein [Chamaesiphon sp.]|uniref:ATP-binding protein n=1 Tax=Chamaesiphon sp. TaxID=2814140 RepID=UPI00359322E9
MSKLEQLKDRDRGDCQSGALDWLAELVSLQSILLIRCNPLDREWIVEQLKMVLPKCHRWSFRVESGDIESFGFSPFKTLLEAIEPPFYGGNHLLDNYLSALATVGLSERQTIYEQFSNLFLLGKSYRLIILQTDDTPLPIELSRFVREYRWAYPTTAEIGELFDRYGLEVNDRNVRLATGLAREDLRRGIERAILTPDPARSLETYRNERLLLLGVKYQPTPVFKEIVGLDFLVEAVADLEFGFSAAARQVGLPFPKGWLLAGIPGTGKTYSASAIASILGYPMLLLEIDKIKVGGIEAMARVLEIAKMCAPCIFYMDEIEKLFSLEDRPILALLLTWLQDKDFPVFVIGTLNRIEHLPVETTRAGRFDRVWEISAPDDNARVKQFLFFLSHYDPRFKDGNLVFDLYEWQRLADETARFVGAEIQQVVINTVLRVKKQDLEGLVSFEDLLASAKAFRSMFKRNEKQILSIQSSIEGLADASNSGNDSILTPRNIDVYAPV